MLESHPKSNKCICTLYKNLFPFHGQNTEVSDCLTFFFFLFHYFIGTDNEKELICLEDFEGSLEDWELKVIGTLH